MLVHQSLDCSVVVVICGCESYFLWGGLVVIFLVSLHCEGSCFTAGWRYICVQES